jgi:acyl carrier protein
MIEHAIQRLVVETLKIDDHVYTEDLAAGDIPEWDSLAHINLLMAVEREFRITLDVADAAEIESVGDLIDAVKRYR